MFFAFRTKYASVRVSVAHMVMPQNSDRLQVQPIAVVSGACLSFFGCGICSKTDERGTNVIKVV